MNGVGCDITQPEPWQYDYMHSQVTYSVQCTVYSVQCTVNHSLCYFQLNLFFKYQEGKICKFWISLWRIFIFKEGEPLPRSFALFDTPTRFRRVFKSPSQFFEDDKQVIIDWLIGGLIDWLIDWSTEWLIDFLTDWLVDWLINWLIDWLTDWLIDWLTDWLIDWLIN